MSPNFKNIRKLICMQKSAHWISFFPENNVGETIASQSFWFHLQPRRYKLCKHKMDINLAFSGKKRENYRWYQKLFLSSSLTVFNYTSNLAENKVKPFLSLNEELYNSLIPFSFLSRNQSHLLNKSQIVSKWNAYHTPLP